MALLAYNRKKQYIASDVEGLIKQLTGFQENEKNFQEVTRFTYSNLIHHNFATVDIPTVKKSMEGLVEKFKLSSLSRRGKRLQELVDKYISSGSNEPTELNVRWYLLLLLIRLSYRPLKVPEEELKADFGASESDERDEEIDWPQYLNQGWEKFRCPSDNSEEDAVHWLSSDPDEDVEESAMPGTVQEDTIHIRSSYLERHNCGNIPHPALWRVQPLMEIRGEALRQVVRQGIHSEEWLRSNVQPPWWSEPVKVSLQSKSPAANMCRIWETLTVQKRRVELPCVEVVSERQLLQEILWMLQVPTDSGFFWQDGQGEFHPRRNRSLCSTTPEVLRSVLQSICPYFTMVNKLKQFEIELVQAENDMCKRQLPRTILAYKDALSQQLHSFFNLVITIESRLDKQEETMTLLSVMEELRPGLGLLRYLHDIHSAAVRDWNTHEPWLCVTRLLSVLYEALLEANNESYSGVLLDLFIQSLHIYLDIADVWLSEGRLEDWQAEFLVTREETKLVVKPYEAEMIKLGISPVSLLTKMVNVVREAGESIEQVCQLNKLTDLQELLQNKGCLFKEFVYNVYNNVKSEENIKKVELSHLTINNLQSIDQRESSTNSFYSAQSATEVCSLILSGELGYNTYNTFPLLEQEGVPKYLTLVNAEQLEKDILCSLVDSPLLATGLQAYLDPRPLTLTTHSWPLFNSVSMSSLTYLNRVLEQQLELIKARSKIASSLVVNCLCTEHRLPYHLKVLRSVFLMDNGDLAQTFYSYIFQEVQYGSLIKSEYMTSSFKVCIEERFPGMGDYFTVSFLARQRIDGIHEAIDSVSLEYKPEWPINLIITQETIRSYNKIFRFLLHLKYAYWILRGLSFPDLAGSPNAQRVRLLQVLKMWMYHSSNTLHCFFMDLVLHNNTLEHTITDADSINHIYDGHKKYLEEINAHCLQDKKSHVEIFIMKLLRLCGSLESVWKEESAGTLTDAKTRRLLEQYQVAYRGLIHCLNIVTENTHAGYFLNQLKTEISYCEPELCYFENP